MHFKMSAICFNLDQSKMFSSGKGLREMSSDPLFFTNELKGILGSECEV